MAEATRILTALALCCGFCMTALGDDWPGWLGAERDSVWRETGILKTLPADGLRAKWRTPVAAGYAGPAVADGKVYLADYAIASGKVVNNPGRRIKLEGRERVLCINADDGSPLWEHEYPCSYDVSYPSGPRVTPTVGDGNVYTLGTMGHLRCLSAATGKLIWSKDLTKEYTTKTPIWGFAGHPLLVDGKLICLVGGSGSVAVAFDKDTGKELWRSLSATDPGYCPPVLLEAGGRRQLVIWHSRAINGLDPGSGKVYWSVSLKPNHGMSIAVPRLSGDHLFASGVGAKGLLLKLDRNRPAAEVVWRGTVRDAVYCANSSPFIEAGVLYGVCEKGELRAVDLLSGRRLWETYAATSGNRGAAYDSAFIVKHEDRYFLFNGKGELIVARLSRDGYEEIGRAEILAPTNEAFGRPVVWSHPAFANRSIYARNDKELVCVSLAAE